GDALPAMHAVDATTSARMHVERLAPAWGVRSTAMPELDALGEIAVAGGTIIRLRQVIDGMPVATAAGGEIRVMVRKDASWIGPSGTLVASDTPHVATAAMTFVDDDAGAVARAVNDLYQTSLVPSTLAMVRRAPDGSRVLSAHSGSIHVALSRARKA